MEKQIAALPDFAYPVLAWAPDPASGSPTDDATRRFLNARQIRTTYFPDTDLRLGWTFVDLNGRCWQAVSSRVAASGGAWWARALQSWIRSPSYMLDIQFEEQTSIDFDKVKSRLHAAVTANPSFYRPFGKAVREEIAAARSLSDLIKSDEARAIENLEPTAWWWQWLFWEGRCSRLPFLVVTVAAGFALPASLGLAPSVFRLLLAVFVVSILALSALVRRLHDLRLSGWWATAWLPWTFLCAAVHDRLPASAVRSALLSAWQLSTLGVIVLLILWPGTRGPNRYGFGPR